MNTCKICKKEIKGRTDKLFCSVACKSYYHHSLRAATKIATSDIDKILHRNRSILLELMGKHKNQMKIPRILLVQKKFSFKYHTHSHLNTALKTYYFVYDFAWMEFSDDELLIVRKR